MAPATGGTGSTSVPERMAHAFVRPVNDPHTRHGRRAFGHA